MSWRPRLLGLALAALALTGCIAAPAPAPVEVLEEPVPPPPPRPAVVVADIGPGVNPYHSAFRRPDWTGSPALRVPGMPEPVPLNLTLGADYAEAREADVPLWEAFQTETLYWVPGTNLLLYKWRPAAEDYVPDGAFRTFHGTGSAGAVNAACPECYILVFQDARSIDGAPIQRLAAEFSWVDIATSTNIPGPAYDPVAGTYDEATRAFWDAGRLFVSFAGNFPVSGFLSPAPPFPVHYTDYPPWVVLVGGAHRDCQATEVGAGKPAEFVANFTQELPASETVEGMVTMSGTSFATPQVAGAFGRALLRIREALPGNASGGALWTTQPVEGTPLDDGTLTQEELRAALAAAATYFDTTGFTPGCGTAVGGPLIPTAAPTSPAPWVEMGWGFLGAEEADFAAAALLGQVPAPEKPAAARAWMEAFTAARAALYPW